MARAWRTCAYEKDAYVVDSLCIGELEACVCFVDLLEIGLEETTGDTAAKHDGEITDSAQDSLGVDEYSEG